MRLESAALIPRALRGLHTRRCARSLAADTTTTFDDFATIAKLYEAVTALQGGDAPDPHGYTRVVCERAHEAS